MVNVLLYAGKWNWFISGNGKWINVAEKNNLR